MAPKFHATPDGQSGLFFTGFGALVAALSLQYPLGKPSQMGPGMFPLILGGLLFIVGLVVLLKSLRSTEGPMDPFEWRPAIVITGAILLSGALLLTVGLLVAIPVLVIVSSLAATEHRWQAIVIATLGLTVGAWAIFILGLGLRIPLIGG